MNAIREVKPPESQSDQEVIKVLTEALKAAREHKYLSVAVSMVSNEFNYSTYTISPGTSITETIGAVEILKGKLFDRWKSL